MSPFLLALQDFLKPHLTADAEGMDPMAWAFDRLMRGTMAAEADRDGFRAECDSLKEKMKGMKPAEEAAAAEAPPDKPMADAIDALALADRVGLTVDPAWTIDRTRREILKAGGVQMADSVTADAVTVGLDILRARPLADSGDAYDKIRVRNVAGSDQPTEGY